MVSKEFYCVRKKLLEELDLPFICDCENCNGCEFYQRKLETPEQFENRTGYKYPPERAVYMLDRGSRLWLVRPYFHAKSGEAMKVICANTDFSPLDKDVLDFEV